jgi:hypothetical protein
MHSLRRHSQAIESIAVMAGLVPAIATRIRGTADGRDKAAIT